MFRLWLNYLKSVYDNQKPFWSYNYMPFQLWLKYVAFASSVVLPLKRWRSGFKVIHQKHSTLNDITCSYSIVRNVVRSSSASPATTFLEPFKSCAQKQHSFHRVCVLLLSEFELCEAMAWKKRQQERCAYLFTSCTSVTLQIWTWLIFLKCDSLST